MRLDQPSSEERLREGERRRRGGRLENCKMARGENTLNWRQRQVKESVEVSTTAPRA